MKVLTDSGLGHLIEKFKGLLPGTVSEESAGLMPQLSGNADDVMHGDGSWSPGGASGDFATTEYVDTAITTAIGNAMKASY